MWKFKHTLIPFAVLLFIIIIVSSLVPFLRGRVLGPAQYPLGFISLLNREIKGLLFFHHNLVENERLRQEMDLLKRQLYGLSDISLENQRLKSLLSLKQEANFNVIAARIIGRDATNWSSIVLIDKGRQHGVRKGTVCITFLGLVGRVVEVHSGVSKVMLLNDPSLGVSALVQRSRQEGLVCGSLGGFLTMKYLPHDSDIKPGDTIETSGLTGNYPKGLLIGTVTEVGDEFSGLSRYAVIKPFVNFSSLEEVLVTVQ